MSVRNFATLAVILLVAAVTFTAGCDTDSNYDERTIVYVSNVNEGYPFIADVINQGDSLYYKDTFVYKYEDDYIVEDWMKVEIHNRPYNSTIDPTTSALGDFLVTGYTVEFVRLDGGPEVVAPFTGEMSLLVPANTIVEAYFLAVPYVAKNTGILLGVQYTTQEIMTNMQVTFHGHEIQTDREIDFSAGVMVNFADWLGKEDPNEH
ncbi:MAG: hypothetical protein JW814_07750 [Candidatus Krumholzibacteriota bacterium]|nr:hypothetical protein [Candidatus Krumholzibacteriota bacterium]